MILTVTRGASAEYQDEQGNAYFSVSQHLTVLDPDAFAGVPPHILAAAGMRGEKLHLYFGLMVMAINGLAEWPDRPLGPLANPFDSIARWVESYKPVVLREYPPETPAADSQLKMAGTPDLPCLLDGDLAIVDLKNGIPRAVHSAQLHSYKKILNIKGLTRVFSLYSRPDGSIAKPIDHTHEHTDWAGVMAANAVLRWRRHRGI